MTTAFFDTKPYDREFFAKAAGVEGVEFRFHEFRLGAETAAAQEAEAEYSPTQAQDIINTLNALITALKGN